MVNYSVHYLSIKVTKTYANLCNASFLQAAVNRSIMRLYRFYKKLRKLKISIQVPSLAPVEQISPRIARAYLFNAMNLRVFVGEMATAITRTVKGLRAEIFRAVR